MKAIVSTDSGSHPLRTTPAQRPQPGRFPGAEMRRRDAETILNQS